MPGSLGFSGAACGTEVVDPGCKTGSDLHGLAAVLQNGEELIKKCCSHLACNGCDVPPPPAPLPGATRVRWCDAMSSSSDADESSNDTNEAVTFNFGTVPCAPAEHSFVFFYGQSA